jgi:hypothetical protein
LAAQCRYPAARCAALAGGGRGAGGAGLGAAERARWRKQARDWLRADLVVWSGTLDGRSEAARVRVWQMLTHWQGDPALAGLREPGALARLPAAERQECRALWQEVAAVLKRGRGAH